LTNVNDFQNLAVIAMNKKIQILHPSVVVRNPETLHRQNATVLAFIEAERDLLGNIYRMLEMKQHDEAKKFLGLHLSALGTWALDSQG
jgi:hypothetical protein